MFTNIIRALGLHIGFIIIFLILYIVSMGAPSILGFIAVLGVISYLVTGYYYLKLGKTVIHDLLSLLILAGVGLLCFIVDVKTATPTGFLNGLFTGIFTGPFVSLMELSDLDWEQDKIDFVAFVFLPTILFWTGLTYKRLRKLHSISRY